MAGTLTPASHLRRRRCLAAAAAIALIGLGLAGDAGAAPGDITTVAGQDKGPCVDGDGLTPGDLIGSSTAVALGYNLNQLAATPDGRWLFLAGAGSSVVYRIDPASLTIQPVAAFSATAIATDPRNGLAPYAVRGTELVQLDPGGGDPTVVVPALETFETGAPPTGLAVAANEIYYAVPPAGAVFRVPVGGGTAEPVVSGLVNPYDVATDALGRLFVAEQGTALTAGDGRLLQVDPGTGEMTVLAENRAGPRGVSIDPTGRRLFLAESGGDLVTEWEPETGAFVQDVAGTRRQAAGPAPQEAPATEVDLAFPIDVAVGPGRDPNLFILDADACVIRKVANVPPPPPPTTAVPTTVTPTTLANDDGAGSGNNLTGGNTAVDRVTAPGEEQALGAGTETGNGGQGSGVGQQSNDGGGGAAQGRETVGGPPAGTERLDGAFGGQTSFSGGRGAVGADLFANQGAGQGAEVGATAPPPSPAAPPAIDGGAVAQPLADPAPAGASPVPAGQPSGTPQGAIVSGDSAGPRGAARYAMVRHDPDERMAPALALAGVGAVAVFGCTLVVAAHAESARGRRRSVSRARPRGAY